MTEWQLSETVLEQIEKQIAELTCQTKIAVSAKAQPNTDAVSRTRIMVAIMRRQRAIIKYFGAYPALLDALVHVDDSDD